MRVVPNTSTGFEISRAYIYPGATLLLLLDVARMRFPPPGPLSDALDFEEIAPVPEDILEPLPDEDAIARHIIPPKQNSSVGLEPLRVFG